MADSHQFLRQISLQQITKQKVVQALAPAIPNSASSIQNPVTSNLVSSTDLPPANNKAKVVKASALANPNSVSSIQNPVTDNLVKILLTEEMIKEALPEEAVKALGGIKKVLELPVRPYFHMQRQQALLIHHDQEYLNNNANKLNRIWLEVGKSEDTILSDTYCPVDSGKPMIAICIKQEIKPFETDEERVQACLPYQPYQFITNDEEEEERIAATLNPDRATLSIRGLTYSLEPAPTGLCDVIFRHCFCKSAQEEGSQGEPSLQTSYVFNREKNYECERFWVEMCVRPYLVQIKNAM